MKILGKKGVTVKKKVLGLFALLKRVVGLKFEVAEMVMKIAPLVFPRKVELTRLKINS